MTQKAMRIGIVTVSDRASRGEYEDLGGPAMRDWLEKAIASEWEAVPRMVADEQAGIESVLKELCDIEDCCLVVTTGGTGPARASGVGAPTASASYPMRQLPPGCHEVEETSRMSAMRSSSLIRSGPGEISRGPSSAKPG